MLEQYWLAAVGVAALVATVAAVSRVILVISRHMRGRVVRHHTVVVTDIVTPLLDERFRIVDTAILNLRLELGETAKVVDEVKAVVTDGLQADVAYLRDRVDGIYDHLVGD